MSLLITDIRESRKGLDTKTDQFELGDINISLEIIHKMDCIILTNGKEFKILKDRYRIGPLGKVYPIQGLVLFIYKYQSEMIETGSIDPSQWIMALTNFLDSKQLTELSKSFEKLAFERA